ncbi:hypothetical protein IWX78_001158 [Mycetocola sp. CAN_C7]|uniref:hypothetical protein n=1 Tax=Mycetocola sp. CAN_C7 TaxID=2787724 RepID=UPI0018CA03D3
MGKVVMYSSVSVDGFVADENDQPGPLFDWLSSGDVPLDGSGELKVSQSTFDYTRPYWDQIGVTTVGRHVFDKRYFGSVHAQHLLGDADAVVQGNRVLHLRYPVRRRPV